MASEEVTYLDHNATTPVDPRILGGLASWAAAWGNPSSIHSLGREPKRLIREARRELAETIGAHPLEIVFTSGGSEANSTMVHSVWKDRGASRPEFIASAVEHPSLVRALRAIEAEGAVVSWVPVSRRGELDLNFLKSRLSERTALVSVMTANNETGTIFPLAQISDLARSVGALVHSDAVQALGKIPFSVEGLDYASFSAHKIHALKGTGALFARRGSPMGPLIHGGGQERSRRGGTENTLGIAAFGKALELCRIEGALLPELRDYFEQSVKEKIAGVSITAAESSRLPTTSSLVIEGVDGETLLMSLDLKGFAVSTGAACSSGSPEPSPVLLSMGLSRAEAQSSLRVSFGRGQDRKTVDRFVSVLAAVVERLRGMKSGERPREAHV